MDIPIARWYQAIQVRHSRRQFNGQKLAQKTTEHLKEFCQNFSGFNTKFLRESLVL